MKISSVLGAASALYILSTGCAFGQFESIWILGEDDGAQGEFSQEQGQQNAVEDGDSTVLDDDYYFAGTTDFVGLVDFDEDWSTFERALTGGDPRVRIHFALTPEEAAGSTEFNLLVDFVQLGGGSTHDVRILFNDSEIFNQPGIDADLLIDQTFLGATVAAVPGENVITVERTGGGSANPWIQFDFLELLAETSTGACPEAICSFAADRSFVKPGEAVNLTFLANTQTVLEIDNGVGAVTVNGDGIGSAVVNPTETTTYTLVGNLNGTAMAEEVTVEVDVILSFEATGSPPLADPNAPAGAPVSRPGQPVTLNWVLADPTATVVIDNGIGNVDGNTDAAGVGSLVLEGALLPAAPTTYTITATRGGDEEALVADVGSAEFSLLWQIGRDDQTQSDFAQEANGETGVDNGDSLALDDDYYFAGTEDAFDLVTETEPWNQFERAITSGDPNVRVHFLMDAEQAESGNFLNLTLDMYAGGSADDGFGVHDLVVTFNDVEVYSQAGVDADFLVEASFTTDAAAAVAGQNVVQVTRSGGTETSWIQFDYLTLELNSDPSQCAEPVCDFSANTALVAPGEKATLTWFVAAGATVSIDNGVGDVTAQTSGGFGSIEVTPAGSTTYTITATSGGNSGTLETTVEVLLLTAFTAEGALQNSDGIARPGQPAKLMWAVDPTATVTIDNGVGDVTGQTVGGIGTVGVNPTGEVTYTLTATRGADVDTAQVTVGASTSQLLFQVGRDDGSVSDFSQEGGSASDSPGDPFALDDDYYIEGNYTAFDNVIGVLDDAEPWVQFERAVTSGDKDVRVHFTMTADQADAANEIRFQMDLFGGGYVNSTPDGPGGTFGVHDVDVAFNGEVVFSQEGITGDVSVDETFAAGSVNAAAGHNVVTVTRTGGDSAGDGGSSGWIVMDYLIGEVSPPGAGEPIRIAQVAFDSVLGDVSVTWTSQLGKSYRIETSTDLKTWSVAKTGIAGSGDTTSDSVSAGVPAPGLLYVRVAEE